MAASEHGTSDGRALLPRDYPPAQSHVRSVAQLLSLLA
jgi:hypothetical protein